MTDRTEPGVAFWIKALATSIGAGLLTNGKCHPKPDGNLGVLSRFGTRTHSAAPDCENVRKLDDRDG
jgi:hypothetical protein